MKRAGRLLLALAFAAIAAYGTYAFATLPYELVQVCTQRATPEGAGVFVVAMAAGLAAVVCAFSGDWGDAS